jgi:hypothetical protein
LVQDAPLCFLHPFKNAGEISRFQTNKRYIQPDGTIVWGNMTIAPIKT